MFLGLKEGGCHLKWKFQDVSKLIWSLRKERNQDILEGGKGPHLQHIDRIFSLHHWSWNFNENYHYWLFFALPSQRFKERRIGWFISLIRHHIRDCNPIFRNQQNLILLHQFSVLILGTKFVITQTSPKPHKTLQKWDSSGHPNYCYLCF